MRPSRRHPVPDAHPRHVEVRLRRGSVPRPGSQGRVANGVRKFDLPAAGDMSSVSLYVACVLIWGSTWLAITYQLGQVPPAVSVAYRSTLAAAILLVYCGVRAL